MPVKEEKDTQREKEREVSRSAIQVYILYTLNQIQRMQPTCKNSRRLSGIG
jgi:hypothetical protein